MTDEASQEQPRNDGPAPIGGIDSRADGQAHVWNTTVGGDLHKHTYRTHRAKAEWPVVVGLPPPRAPAYVDRPELAGLAAAAGTGDSALILQASARTYVGDGGTGKSQLAADVFASAVAGRFGARPDVAIWISAESSASLVASYAEAWLRLHPDLGSIVDSSAAAGQFLDWLRGTERPWLVILDDVSDPAELIGLWPAGARGRLLVTTRDRTTHIHFGGTRVDVQVFSPAEAVRFLDQRLTGSERPRDLAQESDGLAADVGHLPLALAHAAAVIEHDGIPLARYRVMLADRSRSLDSLFPRNPLDAGGGYLRSVESAWSLALDRANGLDPVGAAAAAVLLAAVLDPNGIPESLFTTDSAEVLAGGEGLVGDKLGRAWAGMRNLHRMSVVTHDPLTALVRMHSLAHRATRDQMSSHQKASCIQAAADALLQIWPAIEADPTASERLRSNAAHLCGLESDALWESGNFGVARDETIRRGLPINHHIFLQIGFSLLQSGLAARAVKHFTSLTLESQRRFGPRAIETFLARAGLARSKGEAGDVRAAMREYAALLADEALVLDVDHPEIMINRSHHAHWRGLSGDANGAVAEYQELLKDWLRIAGTDARFIFDIRRMLAYWRGQSGDLTGALNELGKVLDYQTRVLGFDDPKTLSTRGTIANLKGEAGDASGAAAALVDVLTDGERLFGRGSRTTLITRGNILHWRVEAGDVFDAVAASEELLAEALSIFGREHPLAFSLRASVASAKQQTGNLVGAASNYAELLQDQISLLGEDDPLTLNTRFNLAHIEGEAGRPAEAARAFKRLLNAYLRVFGADHPSKLVARGNSAYWTGISGDHAGALELFEALLGDHVRVLGSAHPDTFTTRTHVAFLRRQAGDAAGAVTVLEGLLVEQLRVLGPDHPKTLDTRSKLGSWREEVGMPQRP